MFFNNSDNDPYGDLQRREEYERQKNINMAKSGGNLLFKLIGYWFIFLFTGAFSAMILQKIFHFGELSSLLLGLVASVVIFKVPYVKARPYKSFVVICFIFALFMIAFL